MFNLDSKPKFYNYPLTPSQISTLRLSDQSIQAEIAELQEEIGQIMQKDEQMSLDVVSREKFSSYVLRLEEKIRILQEERGEYKQIEDTHDKIDFDLKKKKKETSEVKNKLLEVYKIDMAAKKYRKSTEKAREIQQERENLERSLFFDGSEGSVRNSEYTRGSNHFIKYNSYHSDSYRPFRKNPQKKNQSYNLKLPKIVYSKTEDISKPSMWKKVGVPTEQLTLKKMSQFRRNLNVSMV